MLVYITAPKVAQRIATLNKHAGFVIMISCIITVQENLSKLYLNAER